MIKRIFPLFLTCICCSSLTAHYYSENYPSYQRQPTDLQYLAQASYSSEPTHAKGENQNFDSQYLHYQPQQASSNSYVDTNVRRNSNLSMPIQSGSLTVQGNSNDFQTGNTNYPNRTGAMPAQMEQGYQNSVYQSENQSYHNNESIRYSNGAYPAGQNYSGHAINYSGQNSNGSYVYSSPYAHGKSNGQTYPYASQYDYGYEPAYADGTENRDGQGYQYGQQYPAQYVTGQQSGHWEGQQIPQYGSYDGSYSQQPYQYGGQASDSQYGSYEGKSYDGQQIGGYEGQPYQYGGQASDSQYGSYEGKSYSYDGQQLGSYEGQPYQYGGQASDSLYGSYEGKSYSYDGQQVGSYEGQPYQYGGQASDSQYGSYKGKSYSYDGQQYSQQFSSYGGQSYDSEQYSTYEGQSYSEQPYQYSNQAYDSQYGQTFPYNQQYENGGSGQQSYEAYTPMVGNAQVQSPGYKAENDPPFGGMQAWASGEPMGEMPKGEEGMDPVKEYQDPCNPCLFYRYEPEYYNEWRCEYETRYAHKRHLRYVPQYYQKRCCVYVPQYYYVTRIAYVPEYYYSMKQFEVPNYYSVPKMRYAKKYYYKSETQECQYLDPDDSECVCGRP